MLWLDQIEFQNRPINLNDVKKFLTVSISWKRFERLSFKFSESFLKFSSLIETELTQFQEKYFSSINKSYGRWHPILLLKRNLEQTDLEYFIFDSKIENILINLTRYLVAKFPKQSHVFYKIDALFINGYIPGNIYFKILDIRQVKIAKEILEYFSITEDICINNMLVMPKNERFLSSLIHAYRNYDIVSEKNSDFLLQLAEMELPVKLRKFVILMTRSQIYNDCVCLRKVTNFVCEENLPLTIEDVLPDPYFAKYLRKNFWRLSVSKKIFTFAFCFISDVPIFFDITNYYEEINNMLLTNLEKELLEQMLQVRLGLFQTCSLKSKIV